MDLTARIELVVAYVHVVAASLGFRVLQLKRSRSTRSVYVICEADRKSVV